MGKDGETALKKIDKAANNHAKPGLKAVDNVAKDLKQSVEAASRSLGSMGSFLRGLGPLGFAATAGLTAIIGAAISIDQVGTAAANSLAAIGDQSDKLGLSTDAYQALNFEADKYRVTQSDLDAALTTANKTTAEAALGTGELYSNLIRLNPEMDKEIQNAGSLEDRLKAVAKGYAASSSEIERQSILLNTFGDNGDRAGEMLLTLEGGLDASTRRAKEAGVVFSEDLITAAQDAAAKIAAADKRIEVSKTKLQVAMSAVAASNKQAMADFINFVAGDALKNTLDGQISAVEESIDRAQARIERLQNPQTAFQRFEASGQRNHNLCLLYTSDAADE